MSKFLQLVRRFGRDERGVFAVIFGMMAIVLVAFSGAVVDFVALEQSRARAQIALDAAALALQPKILDAGATEATLGAEAFKIVKESIGTAFVVTPEMLQTRINREEGSLYLAAKLTMPTMFVNLVGVKDLRAEVQSEAKYRPLDVEISLALDTTGSMEGRRLQDLKVATNDLIDILVKDVQDPYYSKLSIVPYSQAVNVGSAAEAVRGPIRQPRGVETITWAVLGTSKNILDAAKNANLVITANDHGFSDNDWVYISGVRGMTQINSRAFQVVRQNNNKFQLVGVNGTSFGSYSGGGTVTKCERAFCDVLVTSLQHGFQNGEYIRVTDVGGLTGLNNKDFEAASVTQNTLVLKSSLAGGGGLHTPLSGRLHCTWQTVAEGCTYYRFTNREGNIRTFPVSTCATERIANAWNDVAPSTTFLGRNYPYDGCIETPVVPLTSNKQTLKNATAGLVAEGSTGGHLGIAWSWYMLSPNFGYLWPQNSRPAAYNTPNVLKAAIIMTDGEYNSVYCNGVVAQNSTSGSGAAENQINCNAPNGQPYPQARQFCAAMNEARIVVYTVGFQIHNTPEARNLLRDCASSSKHAYLASNGAELRAAFKDIANSITSLRISR